MKLEVGKKYVTRGGEVVEIVGETNHYNYPFEGSNGKTYTANGTYSLNGSSKLDLIREHEEPKMKPHVHAELIKAWADGAEIEYFDDDGGEWHSPAGSPYWDAATIYRIKPRPKPDVVKEVTTGVFESGELYFYEVAEVKNLRLIMDGETGQLKDAEVIK